MRAIDWKKVLYVDPAKITHIATGLFFDIFGQCILEGGDWDKNPLPIEKSIVYQSLHQMFVEGVDWERTSLFAYIMERVEKGIPQWGCKTVEDVKVRRKNELITLYNDLKQNSVIKTQAELRGQWLNDEITVAIDRNGKLLFANNGTHRFFLARILGLKQVPVMVYKRHAEWEEFRNSVFDMCDRFWKGETYQQLPHPDFDEIPTMWTDTRYEKIKAHFGQGNKTVLDIGSLFGNICYKFEQDGFEATAAEQDKNYLRVMYKLRDAYNKFHIFPHNVFELSQKEFDIIVGFNIFHHFIKKEALHQQFIEFLKSLKFNEMYVQFHMTDEPQMDGAYKNYNHEEFAAFIMKHTGKIQCKCIGEERGRLIYKIF
jgi:hypothetical protein